MIIGTELTLEKIGEFLSKLAEKSESVYWLSSPDFKRIIYISPAYEKIWGQSREVLYKTPEVWIEYLVPEDIKDHHPILAMADRVAKLGSTARYDESYRIRRPDGEIRWIIDRGFPIYNEQGECYGITGVAIDITSDKLAEAELLQAKEQAEAAYQEITKINSGLSLIAGSIAHELRTPLSAVSSAMSGILKHLPELLKTYQLAKQHHLAIPYIPRYRTELLSHLCEQIQQEVESAHLVINMLLMKISQPNLSRESFTSISIKDCIDIAIQRYPLTEEERALICWEAIDDFYFQGSQLLIIHVFFNLLKNALYYVKAANKGSIFISLDRRENINRVYFKDTGKGIASEHLPHIFERFYSKTAGGAGIGLAFCQQVMEELGGSIHCDSSEHEYTQFALHFPKDNLI